MEDWSNERMGDAGWGTSRMSERKASRLDAQTAALVRVAAAVARGKGPELEARLAAARDARVPGLWIEELLLQSMLVVGYPLALVAFGAWRGMGGPAPVAGDGAEDLAHADWESWAAGEEIEAVLRLIGEDLDADQRRVAEEQWLDVKRRKL